MSLSLWLTLLGAYTGALAPAPPSAILVTVDTLRGDVLGYAGGAARTPQLDALAQDSWTFSRCMTAATLTNPSHASIMTSLYPRDHGVYDNDHGIADGVMTLAGQLAAHGYHTAALVNFRHLNPEVANLGQGFAEVLPAARAERSAAQVTAEALALIDHLPRPFFVWLHYTDPHAPYVPGPAATLRPELWPELAPMAEAARLAPRFQRQNPWFAHAFVAYPRAADLAARYVAEVENVDAALGQLQRGLQARRLDDQTVLVVTADHGENLGDHGLYFHHGGLYDGTVHVPLIVHAPTEDATQRAGLVTSVDIAPTVLDLLHVPPWRSMRGVTLAPYARGGAPPHRHVFSEHMFGQLAAVRTEAGTLIVHRKSSGQFPGYPFKEGRREVIPAGMPQQAARDLEQALATYLGSKVIAQARRAPPANREVLRSLGYTE